MIRRNFSHGHAALVAFAALVWLGWAAPIAAQDDDRGFLQGLLEDALSSEGRSVRIEGFAGALSSRATIEAITIADEDGVWLRAEDVAMVWSRAALLDRRIDIDALSIGALSIPRPPRPAEDAALPPPEAGPPFSLPDLPVSVDVDSVRIDRADLGAALIGEDAAFDLSGAAQLADGEGSATLSVTRLDRPATLELEGSFDNATRALEILLSLDEPEGGLASDALGLETDTPLALTVDGAGPLNAFDATLDLRTDGVTRLAGTIDTRTTEDGGTAFDADVAGDLAPIVAPDYRAFLGDRIGLVVAGARAPDGALTLERFALTAAALDARGSADLAADGWPERLDLTARIAGEAGPVQLPLPGDPVRIATATLRAGYDRSISDDWQIDGEVDGFETAQLAFSAANLTATGQIDPDGQQVTGDIALTAQGLAPADPALARALGRDVRAGFTITASADAPVTVRDLTLSGADYGLTGTLIAEGQSDSLGVRLTPDLTLRADDLSRFADLAGAPLTGRASVTLAGAVEPVRGAFDLGIDGQVAGLRTGVAQVDPLLSGTSRVMLDAARNDTGILLRQLSVDAPGVRIEASGTVSGDAGDVTLEARLPDIAPLVPGLGGPATLSVDAALTGAAWRIDADATGPGQSRLALNGRLAGDLSDADLAITGTAPLALANPFIAPNTARGQIVIDTRLAGSLDPSALRGTLRLLGGQIALPTANVALSDLAGAATLQGGRATLDFGGALTEGGRITVTGPIDLAAPFNAALSASARQARLSDGLIYDVTLDADATLTGPLTGTPRVAGRIDVAEAELRIPQIGPSFTGIEGLSHAAPPAAVRQSLRRAGMGITGRAQPRQRSGPGLPIALTINAPSRVFVRGRGLDAELGGTLRLGGTTADIVPQGGLSLIRGRFDLLGQRLALTEASIVLGGSFDPILSTRAETDIDGTTVAIAVAGAASDPTLSVTAEPDLPQDEALALLLFNRNVTQLSPLQAVRLAAAIRTLSGSGGTGFGDQVRAGLGVDDFDIVTDEEGNAQARVGAYLSENIYTDVTVGSDGNSSLSLNLDLTPSVTVRGRVESDGGSGLGVFFERDY